MFAKVSAPLPRIKPLTGNELTFLQKMANDVHADGGVILLWRNCFFTKKPDRKRKSQQLLSHQPQ